MFVKKEIKLTKDQVDQFRELQLLEAGIMRLIIICQEKNKNEWERLQKEFNIKFPDNTKINHETKTLIYFVEE